MKQPWQILSTLAVPLLATSMVSCKMGTLSQQKNVFVKDSQGNETHFIPFPLRLNEGGDGFCAYTGRIPFSEAQAQLSQGNANGLTQLTPKAVTAGVFSDALGKVKSSKHSNLGSVLAGGATMVAAATLATKSKLNLEFVRLPTKPGKLGEVSVRLAGDVTEAAQVHFAAIMERTRVAVESVQSMGSVASSPRQAFAKVFQGTAPGAPKTTNGLANDTYEFLVEALYQPAGNGVAKTGGDDLAKEIVRITREKGDNSVDEIADALTAWARSSGGSAQSAAQRAILKETAHTREIARGISQVAKSPQRSKALVIYQGAAEEATKATGQLGRQLSGLQRHMQDFGTSIQEGPRAVNNFIRARAPSLRNIQQGMQQTLQGFAQNPRTKALKGLDNGLDELVYQISKLQQRLSNLAVDAAATSTQQVVKSSSTKATKTLVQETLDVPSSKAVVVKSKPSKAVVVSGREAVEELSSQGDNLIGALSKKGGQVANATSDLVTTAGRICKESALFLAACAAGTMATAGFAFNFLSDGDGEPSTDDTTPNSSRSSPPQADVTATTDAVARTTEALSNASGPAAQEVDQEDFDAVLQAIRAISLTSETPCPN